MVNNSDYTVDYEKKEIGWVSSNFSEFTLKDVKGEILGVYNGGEKDRKLLVIKYDENQKIIHQILLPKGTEGRWYNQTHIFQLFKDTELDTANGLTGVFTSVTHLQF